MSNTQEIETVTGLSVKAFLVTTICILLFGIYIGILIYGENSLTVLNQLKEKKQGLIEEGKALKDENKRLQKKYFELKQLEPKESI
jgi:cell division protein FtsB